MKPKTLRQRARALSRQLNAPPGEILNMVAHAGLDAVEATLADRRGITLPLAFETVENLSPLLSAPATLPVYLPAADGLLLRELCRTADIEAGHSIAMAESKTPARMNRVAWPRVSGERSPNAETAIPRMARKQ